MGGVGRADESNLIERGPPSGVNLNLVIVTASYPFGRTESFLGPELEELQRWGWQVTVAPVWGRGPRRPNIPVPSFDRIATPWHPSVAADALRGDIGRGEFLRTWGGIVSASRRWRARATNLILGPSALALAGELRRRKVDHVHAYWATGPATVAMIAARIAGIPWSFTGHRWDVIDDGSLRRKLESASRVRFISEATRELARGNLERSGSSALAAEELLSRKVMISRLGVDLPATASAPPSGRRFLHPASLVPVKGHEVLLRAFADVHRAFPDARLDLAGDGPLGEGLRARTMELGLSNVVRFCGFLPHQEIFRAYRAGEYAGVVLPSLDLGGGLHEGIPVALIEAMAHGIPVVSTRTGGIPELVVPGAGSLVPAGDPAALAKALRAILEAPEEARRTGEAGRERVVAEFGVGAATRRYWRAPDEDSAGGRSS